MPRPRVKGHTSSVVRMTVAPKSRERRAFAQWDGPVGEAVVGAGVTAGDAVRNADGAVNSSRDIIAEMPRHRPRPRALPSGGEPTAPGASCAATLSRRSPM
jgi:hypothetical protein